MTIFLLGDTDHTQSDNAYFECTTTRTDSVIMIVTRSRTGLASSNDPERQCTVPYLPPEVHRIIAQYIHSDDLPAYRLASKLCASIGTEELFSSLAFHCSAASTARIRAIKACEHLSKYVDSLVWDANSWSIPNVRDLHECKCAVCRCVGSRVMIE